MTEFKKLLLGLVSLALASCGSTPSTSIDKSQMERVLANNASDYMSLYDLFLEQFQTYEQRSTMANLQSALASGRKLLSNQREVYQVTELVYRLMLSEYLMLSSERNFQGIQSFFARNPPLHYVEIAPPHYVKAMANVMQNSASDEQILKWLKIAAGENPLFSRTYYMLATLYVPKEQPELSLYNFKKAFRLDPTNMNSAEGLFWSYSDYFSNATCVTQDNPVLDEAIKLSRTLIKAKPDSPEFQIELAYFYQLKGQSRLFNFTSRKLAEKDPELLPGYKDSLLWLGQFDKLDKVLLEKPGGLDDKFSFVFYKNLMLQDWDAILEMENQFKEIQQPTVFEIIYMANVLKRKKSESSASAFLAEHKNRYEVSYWNHTMFDYSTGKLSAEQLLAKTQSPCEKSEAHFAIALDQLLQNKQDAKQGIENVVAQKVRVYYEDAVSRYWLKTW